MHMCVFSWGGITNEDFLKFPRSAHAPVLALSQHTLTQLCQLCTYVMIHWGSTLTVWCLYYQWLNSINITLVVPFTWVLAVWQHWGTNFSRALTWALRKERWPKKLCCKFEYIYKNRSSHIHNYPLKRCLKTVSPVSPSRISHFYTPKPVLCGPFQTLNPLQGIEWLLFMQFSFSKEKEGNRKACRIRDCGPAYLFSQMHHPSHSIFAWRFPKPFWTICTGLRGQNTSQPPPSLFSFSAGVSLVLWV